MRVSPEIESLVPYKPGKPIEETKRELGLEHVIKLASNENPVGTSPKAIEAIVSAASDLARYPDPTCYRLREKLASSWGVSSEEIVVGNGSNELIDLLIRVFCEPGDKVIYPDKSFVAYGVCAQAARVARRVIPVDDQFNWDIDQFLDDLEQNGRGRDKILFLANPNNPTGTYLSQKKCEQILGRLGQRDDILIVFDEAYNEYVRATDFPQAMGFYKKYANVMVLRTFSKVYGLAGLRVGALVGRPEHLQWINRVRNPFNVNSLAQEATIAAMDDVEYLEQSQQVVWSGLDDIYAFLQGHGLPYTPSQTNFVLFDSLRHGQDFFNKAMGHGLLLRPMGPYGLHRHIRMTIGTAEEMTEAKNILGQVLMEVDQL
jgi:histidinol-phosphate aminotransferase